MTEAEAEAEASRYVKNLPHLSSVALYYKDTDNNI